jgi:tetratricopeptide (TPR) repeat protein
MLFQEKIEMARGRVTVHDLLEEAIWLEGEGDSKEAEKHYNIVLDRDSLNVTAYNRLMIIFRKQKEYQKELAIINRAIKSYEAEAKSSIQDRKLNSKIANLSRLLAKSLGLLTKSGMPVYINEDVDRWIKRRKIVKKKLKK